MFSQLSVTDKKGEEFEFIKALLLQAISNKNNAGFLLFRAKTVIDCRKHYKPPYTPKQLKQFKQLCLKKYKELYPQTIQQSHFDEATDEIKEGQLDPNCLIYLKHLMEKKQAIKNSTHMTMEQIIKLFIDGYFKQANSLGLMFPVIPPSANNTEAIIAYTRNITLNINAYIHNWFTVHFTPLGAPARSSLNPGDYDYKSLVKCFLSLDTMIKDDDLIPLLCADILNYFLNNPLFHTETILDELIQTFNASIRKKCVMLPSDILLVPTEYQIYLSKIKDILNVSLNSEFGYPDGLRITINAIITEQIKNITAITSMLNSEEKKAQLIEYQDITKSRPIQDRTISGVKKTIEKSSKKLSGNLMSTNLFKKGGTKYYKKNITLKNKKINNKSRKHKSKKHKSKKHKSKKHKTRKHKTRKHKM